MKWFYNYLQHWEYQDSRQPRAWLSPALSFPPSPPSRPGWRSSWPGVTEVGGERLGREGFLFGLGEGVWVDEPRSSVKNWIFNWSFLPEYGWSSLTETPHIKHHHIHQELSNSRDQNRNIHHNQLVSLYLEQDAQKGPQVFFPPWQQAGYPPKQSPIPSTRLANWMATTRERTEIWNQNFRHGGKTLFREIF